MNTEVKDLASMDCVPCRGGVPALKGDDLERLKGWLGNDWQVVNEHHLVKTYKFADYADTLAFVNGVAEVAESQGHHPNINFTYGSAEVTIWTHKIDGLTESDFVFGAKTDKVLELLQGEGAIKK